MSHLLFTGVVVCALVLAGCDDGPYTGLWAPRQIDVDGSIVWVAQLTPDDTSGLWLYRQARREGWWKPVGCVSLETGMWYRVPGREPPRTDLWLNDD